MPTGPTWAGVAAAVGSALVAIFGKGAISRWWERKALSKDKKEQDLVLEVRAHGDTKAKVAALEQRVEELERHGDEQADLWSRERIEWHREREDLLTRIEALEDLLLKKARETL